MRRNGFKLPPPWVTSLVLLSSLAVLALLQYRWLDQVREADRRRRVDLLAEAGRRFSEDLDREISRAWLCFLPPRHGMPAQWPATGFDCWHASAAFPALVRDVLRLKPTAKGGWQIDRFEAQAGPVPVSLPAGEAELEELLARLAPGEDAKLGEVRQVPLLADPPGLLIPVGLGHRRMAGPERRRSREGRPSGASVDRAGYLLVRFDAEVLLEQILPELAHRYFDVDGESEYRLVVREAKTRKPEAATVDRPLLVRGPQPAASGRGHVDLSVGLFGLLPGEQMRRLAGQLRLSSWRPEVVGPHRSFAARVRVARAATAGRWRLEVTHVAGSLDRAVSAGMHRSLALGLGSLAVLALSFWAMDLSARRALRLAGQQLNFVAGITHELMTPLAAVRSAGQNLADAVVVEPEQVRRYGSLIEKEGRRLSVMVSEILDYAGMQAAGMQAGGMQAGGRQLDLRRVAPARLIEAALAANRPALEQTGLEVHTEVEERLPLLWVDEQSLVRALSNLIGNAIKYAHGGGWLALRARRGQGPAGGGVELIVEDRGPGIAKADEERIFEPFVRGHKLVGSNVPGTGIGLSLVRHVVEAHDGRVRVAKGDGGGALFTLWLPVAPEGES